MRSLLFSLTYLWLLLMPLVEANDDSVCDKLLEQYTRRNFLRPQERERYCFNGCDFLKVDCLADKPETAYLDLLDFSTVILEKAEEFMNGQITVDQDVGEFDPATLDAWHEVITNSWPLILSVIPILLNQWKYYNFWTACGSMFINLLVSFTGMMSFPIAFHNALVTFLCLIHSSNSSYLVESIWTIMLMMGAVCSIFLVDPILQVSILLGSVIGFIGYVHWCFFVRRGGATAGVVIVVAQLMVLMEQLHFTRTRMADASLGGAAIEMCLNAILPSGDTKWYWFNIGTLSTKITKRLYWDWYPALTFIFFFLLQVCMFIAVRASIGTFYLHVLRYRTDFGSLRAGLYVYTTDFWGPYKCLFRIVFKYESYQHRRMMYAVLGSVFNYFEMKWSYEYHLFRLIVSSFELLFVDSHYSRMTHYLQFDLDMMQVAFPQANAPPWIGMDQLEDIAKFTSMLVAKSANGFVKGMSVVLCSGGRPMLYTVKHVTRNIKLVQFLGQSISSPHFGAVNPRDKDDPIVAMKVEVPNAPVVEILTKSEAYDVKQLVFINEDADSKKFICVVPKFELNLGKLYASVNLRKGDSGGPCFSVLESGELRFCGVVSKGNPRRGGGNLVSFCYHSGELECDSSQEGELGTVQQFNKARRVRFDGDDDEDVYREAKKDITRLLRDNYEELAGMKEWKSHMLWDDRTSSADDIYDHLASIGAFVGLRSGRDDDDQDPHDDGNGSESKRKTVSKGQDRRRRNKDKAARKRAVNTCQRIALMLPLAYSLEDSQNFFYEVAHGNVPELEEDCIIDRVGNGHWIIDDDEQF